MIRKTVSLTLLLSGILVLLTSVVLYIEPEGRVAYWADWRLLGLDKPQWGNIHVTTGFLFLLAFLLHVYYNFKAITAYLKNKAREMVVMTKPFVISLVITLLVTVGTLLGWPPMQQVLDLGEHFKESAAQIYGNPPYGHAELTPLGKFMVQMGFDRDAVVAGLEKAGIRYGSLDQSLKEVARANNVSPQVVFVIMRDASGTAALPEAPPPGTGKMTLSEIAEQYGRDVNKIVAYLGMKGVDASPGQTMKEVAEGAFVEPVEIYGIIRDMPATSFSGGNPAGGQGKNRVSSSAAPATAAEGSVPQGLGRMTLSQACETLGKPAESAIKLLESKGVEGSPEMTVREAADELGVNPHEFYEMVKNY